MAPVVLARVQAGIRAGTVQILISSTPFNHCCKLTLVFFCQQEAPVACLPGCRQAAVVPALRRILTCYRAHTAVLY
eukprot:scaffold294199_cov18-Tisochrysis_lutea.AAC.2